MSALAECLPVLIIGAGIAGLSLARTLEQHGVNFKLFEALSSGHNQGYGITLRSWSFDPLLKRLGVSSDSFKALTATDSPIGGCGYLHAGLKDLYTGKDVGPIGSADDAFRANRNLLRAFLLNGVEESKVAYDKRLNDMRFDNGVVVAVFENGECVRGRLLVAADGVHSQVRNLRIPSAQPKLLAADVYNGQIQFTRPSFDSNIKPWLHDTNVQAAVGENAIFGLSITALNSTDASLSWFYSRPGKEPDDGLEQPRQTTTQEIIAEMQSLGTVASPFRAVLSTDSLARTNLYHWPMRALRVSAEDIDEQATRSNIAFIGDSVHAMPIFAGEGGNHGLQDGFELGVKLTEATIQQKPLSEAVISFYKESYGRWQAAITKSEARMHALHRPMSQWKQSSS